MTKGAYVAGRTSDVERVRRVQDAMRRAGYEITFDWTGPGGEIRKDWGGVAHERGAALSQREIAAVHRADVTVLCWMEATEGRPAPAVNFGSWGRSRATRCSSTTPTRECSPTRRRSSWHSARHGRRRDGW
jgi:hypothetical protein